MNSVIQIARRMNTHQYATSIILIPLNSPHRSLLMESWWMVQASRDLPVIEVI